MNKKEKNNASAAAVYTSEYQLLEESRRLLETPERPPETLENGYRKLLAEYEKLLKHIVKITHIGDANQRKLFQAYEQIEHQKEELSKAYTQMELLAHTDPLTQLSNRRDFLQKCQGEIYRVERPRQPFCIVMSDIDHFKQLNDRHGHDCGDIVLKETAEVLKESLRKNDLICRWGGEEFIMLLPECRLQGALLAAENLRGRIAEKNFSCGHFTLSITMTFGVAMYEPNQHIDDCIKKADQALYCGKQNGRNRVAATPPIPE